MDYSVLGKIMIALTKISQYWGLLLDVIEKMSDPDFASELAKFARKELCWTKVAGTAKSILRLISDGQTIVISATSGQKTIAQAADIFTWGIDSDFKNWGLDVPGEAKPATSVEVHEMIEDGDFKTIFGSLGRKLDDLCLTQEQIVAFVRDHKKWLRKGGCATFFLFKVGDKFFVARAFLDARERPGADIRRFSFGSVWYGDFHLRIVVPQTLKS